MAVKSISAKKMRSFLTMLGIIIGVAAVIIMVSVVQGQNKQLKEYYASLGSNKITVYASTYNGTDVSQKLYDYCLTINDLVVGVTPNAQIWDDITIKYGTKTLSTATSFISMGGGMAVSGGMDDYNNRPRVILGSDQYSLCENYTIESGRDLSYLDVKKYNQVCVIGSRVKQNLFNFSDPIGKTITINNIPFTVIGTYESKGVPGYDESVDSVVSVPYTTGRMLTQYLDLSEFTVKARNADTLQEAITRIGSYLNGVINKQGWVNVYTQDTWINESNNQNLMMSLVLGGIAGISLIVGGIGIMNIMLVTVTERTREIGIRKAIGAERKSIITQFLIESAMICSIGGIIGILIGYLGTMIAGKLILKTVLLPGTVITLGAFLFSVVLGIIFGMYPAIKASGLQPVEALRAE